MKIISNKIIFNGDIDLLKQCLGYKVKYLYDDKINTGYLIKVKDDMSVIFSDNEKHRWSIFLREKDIIRYINKEKTYGWHVDNINILETI